VDHHQRERVKQGNGIGNLDAENKRAKATKVARRLRAEGDEVLTADRANFNRKCVLLVVDAAIGVVRDGLLGCLS
jgi:hypothetical protein